MILLRSYWGGVGGRESQVGVPSGCCFLCPWHDMPGRQTTHFPVIACPCMMDFSRGILKVVRYSFFWTIPSIFNWRFTNLPLI